MQPQWQEPTQVVPLGLDGLQVWALDLSAVDRAALLARVPDCLTETEVARIESMRSVSAKEEFAAARLLLRALLGFHLGIPPQAVPIAFGPHQKPQLSPAAKLDFNLSHSRGIVLVVLSHGGTVGIDVEWIDPEFADDEERMKIAVEHFDAEQCRRIASFSDPKDRLRPFYAAWTRQEALLKADGCGLTHANTKECSERLQRQFVVKTFPVLHDYVASLATRLMANEPKFFQASRLLL